MVSIYSLIFGVLTFLAILLGGKLALKFKNNIHILIAFCAGILIAASLLDILPESIELIGNDNNTLVFSLVLISFLFFHFLDKVVFLHSHSHSDDDEHLEEEHDSNPLGLVSSIGIIFHTFLDGLVIGTGFLIGNTMGIMIAFIILLHDFTDGISTVTLMLRHKQSLKSIKIILFSAGIATMFGIVLAQLINPNSQFLGSLLAVFAGFFLYLGAVDLLPEAHKDRSSIKLVAFTVLGAILVLIFKLVLV